MGTRKLVVEVVGDSRSLERAFSRSSTATTRFGHDVDTTAAKVDRSFTRMQRVMAGGFLGGAAATAGIAALRQVVNVASEAETVIGQTSVAVESAGISWEKYAQRIQTAITAQSRLGFDDEALLRTFSLFVRQAGSVDEALRRNAIAADVSRARFIDLEQAAQIVNKAALGQAGALRRLGIDAKTGATGVELLTQLEKQFGGAAAEASDSAAAASQRFHVAVENLQEQLGSVLLPTITGLADGTARFIDNLSGIADVKIPEIRIPFVTEDRTPGRKRDRFTVTDLLGAGLRASRDLERDILGLEGEHRASPEAITAGAKAFDAIYQSAAEAFETGAKQAAADAKPPSFGQPGFKVAANNLGKALQDAFDASMDSLDLKLDKAEVTAGIADDLQVADQIIAGIEKRIASQGRTTALLRMLFRAQEERRRIISDNNAQQQRAAQEARDDRQRRAEERARAAEEAREAATEARQERQFRALGLDAEGDKPTPTVANLEKQLPQLTARLLAEGEMTPKIRAALNRAGKVLSGAFGPVTEQTREAVRDMFRDIRGTFESELGKDLVPDIRSVTLTDKILNALGFGQEADAIGQLGVDKRRGTRGRNATTVSGPSAVNMYGPVTVVADNPDAFLRELQKKAGRTTATSRGRFPGKSMGLG